jgi:hypothetical protein
MRDSWPPVKNGTCVRTTQPHPDERREFTPETIEDRKGLWGLYGVVVTHHDSHGLCYEVAFEGGRIGVFMPSEVQEAGRAVAELEVER